MHNDDGRAHTESRLLTSSDYVERVVKPFKLMAAKVSSQEEHTERAMVVLDVFAGIGTLLVVLKRLGIAVGMVSATLSLQASAHYSLSWSSHTTLTFPNNRSSTANMIR
jgi:hypothetical protein